MHTVPFGESRTRPDLDRRPKERTTLDGVLALTGRMDEKLKEPGASYEWTTLS